MEKFKKIPKCCNKPMELKNIYYSGSDYFCFQCKKCGKIIIAERRFRIKWKKKY